MTEFGPLRPGDDDPRDKNEFARLEVVLERDRELLEALIETPEPLTVSRLDSIDPRLGALANEMAQTAVLWPDASSSIAIPIDSVIRSNGSEIGNQAFAHPILREGTWAYNNFFLIVGTEHRTPDEAVLNNYLDESEDIYQLGWGTKPYVERAHALVPDFMSALQKATKRAANGADEKLHMNDWNEAIMLGHFDQDEHPDEYVLLNATRIAYSLLGLLMRRDDHKIQYAMLRMPTGTESEITDPDVELRT